MLHRDNVAKGIHLYDKKKQFLFIQENFHASKSFWKIYLHKYTCNSEFACISDGCVKLCIEIVLSILF